MVYVYPRWAAGAVLNNKDLDKQFGLAGRWNTFSFGVGVRSTKQQKSALAECIPSVGYGFVVELSARTIPLDTKRWLKDRNFSVENSATMNYSHC